MLLGRVRMEGGHNISHRERRGLAIRDSDSTALTHRTRFRRAVEGHIVIGIRDAPDHFHRR